jgi:hypothetical protein
MLFWAPPPPPVSYSADVAPIFAMHCNSCHGDAGGLSTRTHAELMTGGHLGRVIIPGDPDRSLLIHFVDGRRGKEQLMPLGGRPLMAEQIETIRRWIAAGAREDRDTTKQYMYKVSAVQTRSVRTLRVSWRIRVRSYVTLNVRDPGDNRLLLTEVFSIKSPRERVDAGEPGDLISWDVRPASFWPGRIDLELVVQYAAEEPGDPELSVTTHTK